MIDVVADCQQGNVARTYKFGLLYCGDAQTTEEQMYGNKHASDGFEDFLDMLGERVPLTGFTKFKGGLDTQSALFIGCDDAIDGPQTS